MKLRILGLLVCAFYFQGCDKKNSENTSIPEVQEQNNLILTSSETPSLNPTEVKAKRVVLKFDEQPDYEIGLIASFNGSVKNIPDCDGNPTPTDVPVSGRIEILDNMKNSEGTKVVTVVESIPVTVEISSVGLNLCLGFIWDSEMEIMGFNGATVGDLFGAYTGRRAGISILGGGSDGTYFNSHGIRIENQQGKIANIGLDWSQVTLTITPPRAGQKGYEILSKKIIGPEFYESRIIPYTFGNCVTHEYFAYNGSIDEDIGIETHYSVIKWEDCYKAALFQAKQKEFNKVEDVKTWNEQTKTYDTSTRTRTEARRYITWEISDAMLFDDSDGYVTKFSSETPILGSQLIDDKGQIFTDW